MIYIWYVTIYNIVNENSFKHSINSQSLSRANKLIISTISLSLRPKKKKHDYLNSPSLKWNWFPQKNMIFSTDYIPPPPLCLCRLHVLAAGPYFRPFTTFTSNTTTPNHLFLNHTNFLYLLCSFSQFSFMYTSSLHQFCVSSCLALIQTRSSL